MKKLLFLMAVVLAALVSCTETKIDADTISGDLELNTIVETGGNENLKSSVNRTTEPVYVKGLDIDILKGNDVINEATFSFVEDGSGEDVILIEGVSLEADRIEVSSIPAIECNLPIKFFALDNQDLVDESGSIDIRNNLLSHIQGLYNISELVSYAEYYGEQDFAMTPGNSEVEVNLDTQHGRDFGTIINGSDYIVKVVMSVVGQGTLGNVSSFTYTFEPNSDKAIGYYWGNEYATEGTQGIKFQFTWYDAHGKIVKTDNRWRIISRAKESYWGRLNVTNSDIQDETLKSMFTFEEIIETGGNTDI